MILLTFLTIFLPSLTMSASQSSDFLMPGALVTPTSEPSPKCRLTRLEEDIAQMEKLETSKHYLPTLRQLKKKYPREQFVRSPVNSCSDNPVFQCPQLARMGACNGSYEEIERRYIEEVMDAREFHKQHGFRLREPGQPSARQIEAMQVECRPSCHSWLSSLPPHTPLSPELLYLGGLAAYEDVVTDEFGVKHQFCSLGEAMITSARSRHATLALSSFAQPPFVPRFHPHGFQKVAIPRDMFARILTGRKKSLASHKWILEPCDPGNQNCALVVESKEARESHLISRENYHYLGLQPVLQEDIYRELRDRAQDWIQDRVELAGSAIYGIRRYGRGAKLIAHLDHLKTHVISAILNIAQEVDSPWPLQIRDHSGRQHNVLLKPGQMIWYESASLVHARSLPLNGTSYENMFVHFMPRAQPWYTTDWNIRFGRPDPLIRIEDLERGDKEMREQREKEKHEMEELGLEEQELGRAGKVQGEEPSHSLGGTNDDKKQFRNQIKFETY